MEYSLFTSKSISAALVVYANMAIYARLWRTRIGATEDSRENRHSRCDGKNSRPGDQDSDEVLKEIPGQKRTSRSTRGESSRPELPLQSQNSTFKLNNQVFSRIAGRGPAAGHARRCGNVDTLLPRERQSIQASPGGSWFSSSGFQVGTWLPSS